jgi:hypothetical protein
MEFIMKTYTRTITFFLTVLIGSSLACSNGDTLVGGQDDSTSEVNQVSTCCLETVNDSSFTVEEIESLYFMAEEEKLARDVYLELFDRWGSKSFYNISQSEQQHINAVTNLLERSGQSLPSTLNSLGEFENQELQNLFNELMDVGSQSLVDALKVGALIEEVDIEDIDKLRMTVVTHPAIDYVYNALREGSENHLRAYVRNLSNQGIDYTPSVLTLEQYDEIIGQ